MTRDDVLAHLRQRAGETLQDARTLLEKGHLHSVVNRIYYALFYETSALLMMKNLVYSSHGGLVGAFNREFVKTGRLSADLGRFLSRMFKMRTEGDYGDWMEFQRTEVVEWLAQAGEFIHEIEILMGRRDA